MRNWYFVVAEYLYTVDFEWLKRHNYGISLYTTTFAESVYYSTAAWDAYFNDYFALCAENDIPVELILNEISVPHDRSTTVDTYASMYNDLLTHIEAKWGPSGTDGHVLEQYWYEQGFDNFATWLRGATDLKIVYALYYDGWLQAGTTGWNGFMGNGSESKESALTLRIGLSDEICLELWCVWDAIHWAQRECGKYIRDNFPDMTVSINTLPTIAPEGNSSSGWWTIERSTTPATQIADPLPTYSDSINRFKRGVQDITDYMGPVDSVHAQPMAIDGSGAWKLGFNYWQWQKTQLQMFEDLAITSQYKTIYADVMSQHGTIPTYHGPGICKHVAPLIDEFTNTGHELILLKNVDYDGSCRVHDISVTSTDTITHEDYTIACSPERGTIIGPYPLDAYGPLPTITYDNTNVYVSILKVAPTQT